MCVLSRSVAQNRNIHAYKTGHVAFPGGRAKQNESNYDCCCRETMEELGINLKNKNNFLCLGTINDFKIKFVKKPFVVRCFIFLDVASFNTLNNNNNNNNNNNMNSYSLLKSHNNANINLKEVADAQWINLSQFVSNNAKHVYLKVPLIILKLQTYQIKYSGVIFNCNVNTHTIHIIVFVFVFVGFLFFISKKKIAIVGNFSIFLNKKNKK